MWFPPYEIQFNEMNSVNWESNNFIGRGESVYTIIILKEVVLYRLRLSLTTLVM
jgi:hypothetical protein